jgi:hypothetical protein
VFLPGFHRRAFSVSWDNDLGRDLIWSLQNQSVIAKHDSQMYCADPARIPFVKGQARTLGVGTTNPSTLLATAGVADPPGAALTPTVVSVSESWLGDSGHTVGLTASSDLTLTNVAFDNGAITAYVTVQLSAVNGVYFVQLRATTAEGLSGEGLPWWKSRTHARWR